MQIQHLTSLAASRGWTDTVVITETCTGGISPAALGALTGFDVVIFYKLDRLSRSVTHTDAVVGVLQRAGVKVMTSEATYDIAVSVSMALRHAEAEQCADRMRRRREQARARRTAGR